MHDADPDKRWAGPDGGVHLPRHQLRHRLDHQGAGGAHRGPTVLGAGCGRQWSAVVNHDHAHLCAAGFVTQPRAAA